MAAISHILRRGIRRYALGEAPNPSGVSITTNLIHYWTLDEASNGNRADSVGSITLTDNNSNVKQATGLISSCADFHTSIGDSGERLVHTNDSTLQVNSGDSLSLSFWVKISTLGSNQGIISKFGSQSEYLVWIDVSSNLAMQAHNAANSVVSLTIKTSPSTGAWHHVVAGYDDANGQVFSYFDNGTKSTAACVGIKTDATAQFCIGNYANGFPFNGFVDEVAFYKRVLSASEVSFLYNSGSGRAYPY